MDGFHLINIRVLLVQILVCIFVGLIPVQLFCSGGGDFHHKIAYLREGEVYIADSTGGNVLQITHDSGKVEDFLFSPTLKYLAYTKIIGYADEPGLWEDTETIPQRAIHSIKIVELKSGRIINEIMPQTDPWIYIQRWLPGDILMFYASSGFDVSGFFSYNTESNTQQEIGIGQSDILSNGDYSDDGSLECYVSDSGLGTNFRDNIHLVDLRTHNDRIVVSLRGTIEQKLSHSNTRIAFVLVEDSMKSYLDNFWICDTNGSHLTRLYRQPARPKPGLTNFIAWSPDDRFVGTFFPGEGVIFDLQNPATNQRLEGSDFSWLNDSIIVFARQGDIYLYDLASKHLHRLIQGAQSPVVVP